MKLLLQLADSLVEKGHAHAASIKTWVASVDKRYKDFSSRMEKYRVKLETTLGLSVDVSTNEHALSYFLSSRVLLSRIRKRRVKPSLQLLLETTLKKRTKMFQILLCNFGT